MKFNECTSLRYLSLDFDMTKSDRMVTLDHMNFNQIQWCKEKELIESLKSATAKQLDMCGFYAIISSECISEFDSL